MPSDKKPSIFDTVKTDTKKPKIAKDPTSEELAERRRKEKEYAMNIQKTIDEVRAGVERGDNLDSLLDKLYAQEKQTRKAGQGENTTTIVKEIIDILGKQKQWKMLNENILTISKKRNQIKQAITSMVQHAMTFFDNITDKETKVELINTLRRVCEGKIYVELEQAHLVQMLANIKEEECNVEEAANLIQTIQVETIGSMQPSEKIELILMQIRLCLAKKDYVRAYIISKKVTSRAINRPEHKALKIRFYELLIQYWKTKKDYLEIAKCYKEIFDSVKDEEDSSRWEDVLKNLIIFVCLSPFDNHQSDLMHRAWGEKRIEEPKMRLFKQFLRKFVEKEVINGPNFQKAFVSHLKSHQAFTEDPDRQKELSDRTVEHNLRIIASYYKRIHLGRLAELLNLGQQETESFISKLVTKGTIQAKIDRLEGVVNFRKQQKATDILNEWNSDIASLLEKVEKVQLRISKEQMSHKNAKSRA